MLQRSEVNFESELKRVIESNDNLRENAFPGQVTDERHIPFIEQRDVRSVAPRLNLDYNASLEMMEITST